MKDAQYWIQHLNLVPHPEGGYYKEVYRSEKSFIPQEIGAERNYITSIYFLIEQGNVSHFHSIQQDEIWFYHAGDSLEVHTLCKTNGHQTVKVGPNANNGECLQATVPAKSIFGSKSTGVFSLVSCVVAPGFDFKDFKLFTQQELLQEFPNFKTIIDELGMP